MTFEEWYSEQVPEILDDYLYDELKSAYEAGYEACLRNFYENNGL